MIVYERFESPANGFETRSYILALFIVLFKTGPQNRVRAATFATQRRSLSGLKPDPAKFQIYIPPFNRLVFIFSLSSKKQLVTNTFMNSPFYSSTSFQKQPNTHQCNILTMAFRSNALGKINIPSVLFDVWFMGTAPP